MGMLGRSSSSKSTRSSSISTGAEAFQTGGLAALTSGVASSGVTLALVLTDSLLFLFGASFPVPAAFASASSPGAMQDRMKYMRIGEMMLVSPIIPQSVFAWCGPSALMNDVRSQPDMPPTNNFTENRGALERLE